MTQAIQSEQVARRTVATLGHHLHVITDRRERIEALLTEAEEFEERFRIWQERPEEATPAEIRSGHRAYQSWFARSLEFVPDESKDEFRDMYEGGTFITRIRGFLSAPLTVNALYDPKLADSPFAPDRYPNPFESDLKANLERQRAILVMSIEAVSGDVVFLDESTMLFRRLSDYLGVFRAAQNPRIGGPNIENEADLQVVVEAILRLHFDDVRPEDYVSKYAGGASRVDFLLRQPGIIIETKMTRSGLLHDHVNLSPNRAAVPLRRHELACSGAQQPDPKRPHYG